MGCIGLDFNIDPILILSPTLAHLSLFTLFFINLMQKRSKLYKLQIFGLFLNLYKTKQKQKKCTDLKATTSESFHFRIISN